MRSNTTLCACGCRGLPPTGRRFVRYHWLRLIPGSVKSKASMSRTRKSRSEGAKKILFSVRSANSKKMWTDSTYRALRSKQSSRKWENTAARESIRRSMSISKRTMWRDNRAHMLERLLVGHNTPHARIAHSEASVKKWRDPKFRKRMQVALNLKPNYPETVLIPILSRFGYRYVGDFSYWIGNRNPDFVSKDGRSAIEHYGRRFHSPSDEATRVQYFGELGVSCLVIWNEELGDLATLVRKIEDFHGNAKDERARGSSPS